MAWRRAHLRRRQTVRLLRKAGYVARHRWPRELVGQRAVGPHLLDDRRYTAGPAVGAQAVDPWELADDLQQCASSWTVQLRHGGRGFHALPLPRPCGRTHLCPVCAMRASRGLAGAIRAVLADDLGRQDGQIGGAVHLTLTQRDYRGESLQDAITRWRGAWECLTRGRPGRRLRESVAGWYYGLEVTRGEGSDSEHLGPWWHVHAHVLLVLRKDRQPDDVRREIASTWASSADWLLTAAMNREDETMLETSAREAAGETSGPWWEDLDLGDPALASVREVAKYPVPSDRLHPIALAEFCSVSHGRRWHQGGGMLRGVKRDAELIALEDEADAEAVDLGEGVCYCAPGDCPDVDALDHGIGWVAPVDPSEAVAAHLDGQGFSRADPSPGTGPADGGLADVTWRILPGPVIDALLTESAAGEGELTIGYQAATVWEHCRVRDRRLVNEHSAISWRVTWTTSTGWAATVMGRTLREIRRARAAMRAAEPGHDAPGSSMVPPPGAGPPGLRAGCELPAAGASTR
jgi:hypothetical protein